MFQPLFLLSGASCILGATERVPERLTVDVHTTASSVRCPGCQRETTRAHRHYQRTLADLPLAHIPVQIRLHVRRFFCDNAICTRKTFSEPVPAITMRGARRTTRLATAQRYLGLEVGDEPGARLARRHGMAVSADMLLRLARHESTTPVPTSRHLGIDDVARCKGQRYGTIVVDLDTHRPVDLQPERAAKVVEQWLSNCSRATARMRTRMARAAALLTRFRSRIAFTSCSIVREMLQRVCERHQTALQAATQQLTPTNPPAPATESRASFPTFEASEEPPRCVPAVVHRSSRCKTNEACSQERRHSRHAHYLAVRALLALQLTDRAIAAPLHLSRQTVRRSRALTNFLSERRVVASPASLTHYSLFMHSA